MRYIIFGAGAIGGVVGARLHQSGHEVALIARGAHYEAIARDGLRLVTPDEDVTLRLPVASEPGGLGIADRDVVLVATKGQDTWAALGALRAAAGERVPVVMMQNGVENERIALRLFEHVYGAVVMTPTAHLEPGLVVGYTTVHTGMIDVGRYPSGVDRRCEEICAALVASTFESTARPDIVRHKHAKLVLNLGNAVQAICGTGPGVDAADLGTLVAEEGRRVLTAAGIDHVVEDVADLRGRWTRWGYRDIPAHPRGGGSTWQSVMRGAGHVETDFLNGEICLQARLLGIDAPINAVLQSLTAEMVRDGHPPGWLTPAQVLERAGVQAG